MEPSEEKANIMEEEEGIEDIRSLVTLNQLSKGNLNSQRLKNQTQGYMDLEISSNYILSFFT